MAADDDHCAALVREADRDRYLATVFAPAPQRGALFALYAFNAEIARVRELAREPMPGEIRLQWWREALARRRDGEAAAHPVAAALLATLTRYALGPERLIGLIEARVFDLYDSPMKSFAELESYGCATQGTIFSLAAGILGANHEAVEALARHAGIAYAIAGVLRGFASHASHHQLYLPDDALKPHAVDRANISSARARHALSFALADMRARARRHVSMARAELTTAPAAILPAFLPGALIAPELDRMERADYDPFNFAQLPAWRRQWLIWRAARDPRRIFNG